MKFSTTKPTGVSLLATFGVLCMAVAPAPAESLAGSKGHVRFPAPPLGVTRCENIYNAYVAAGGHSAYAQTPIASMSEFVICEIKLNAASQKAAETLALKSCRAVRDSHSVDVGVCAIAASK